MAYRQGSRDHPLSVSSRGIFVSRTLFIRERKGIHMSDERRIYREGETVPVPDKGGWIDGETGQVLPTPPPEIVEPTTEEQQEGEATPQPSEGASAPSVPRRGSKS